MHERKFLITILLMFAAMSFMCSSDAAAQEQPDAKTAGYGQAGAPATGVCQLLDVASTEETLTFTDPQTGSRTNACLPIGTLVRFKFIGGTGAVAYSSAPLADGISFTGNANTEQKCQITDSNGFNGDGMCTAFSDHEPDDMVVPRWDILIRRPTARVTGFCSVAILGPLGGLWYPMCRTGQTCPASGTCTAPATDAALTQKKGQTCAYAIAHADTTNTLVCWTVVK